jgi:hypothetical protein
VASSPHSFGAGPNFLRHSEEFKREAVRLVTEQHYTFAAAAKAVGVSDQTLRLCRGGAVALVAFTSCFVEPIFRTSWGVHYPPPAAVRKSGGMAGVV